MPIPVKVDHADLMRALEPLCELLGTSVNNYFADPGIVIGPGHVTFTVPMRHETDPSGRVQPEPAWDRAPGDHPHPQGKDDLPIAIGSGESAEFGYIICVDVALPGEDA